MSMITLISMMKMKESAMELSRSMVVLPSPATNGSGRGAGDEGKKVPKRQRHKVE